MHATPQRQASRDKILDSAEQLFARRGFSGVGLAEVAESVGFGKSSLFHHFRSKAELYAAVIARILERIEHDLTQSLARGGQPVERVERWLDGIIDLLAENPSYPRLLLRSLFEDDELTGELPDEQAANASIQRVLGAAGRLLREGMAAGQIRSANVAHTLQSIIGMTVYHFASGEFGDELLGRSIFAEAEVRRRKAEVKMLVRHGLLTSHD
jgi:AcrR family transcriptional regulator